MAMNGYKTVAKVLNPTDADVTIRRQTVIAKASRLSDNAIISVISEQATNMQLFDNVSLTECREKLNEKEINIDSQILPQNKKNVYTVYYIKISMFLQLVFLKCQERLK